MIFGKRGELVGREGIWIDQPSDEPVDVAQWEGDEEFAIYPEGARDKSLIISPPGAPRFLVRKHRYLFKHAFDRYPDQFWAEIIAYRIGCTFGTSVPPAFVAWDSSNGQCGALIEWFLDYPGEIPERYVAGGDIMTSMIRGFDRKKGGKHNFETIEVYLAVLGRRGKLQGDWLLWWCDTLLFDALIGNTDRHQDNWGLLWREERARMAPAFDNGTSLGHEIMGRKLAGFFDRERMERYVGRGTHHMRWRADDEGRPQHAALISRLLERFPAVREHARSRLERFNIAAMRTIIRSMTEFEIPVPLSPERAEFVSDLTETRYRRLLDAVHP